MSPEEEEELLIPPNQPIILCKDAYCIIVRNSQLKTGSLYEKHVSNIEEEQEEDTILEDEFNEE